MQPDNVPSGGGDRVLGVVVTYSDVAGEPQGLDPRWGRLYPMRQGDALLFGKPTPPAEVALEEGTKVRVTASHSYPLTNDYAMVSRRHALIQMIPGGTTLVTDFSLNGIYVEGVEEHWPGAAGRRSQTHVLTGDQSLVLAVDLSQIPGERQAHARLRVQIVRFDTPPEKRTRREM
jgi:hypothetical protein